MFKNVHDWMLYLHDCNPDKARQAVSDFKRKTAAAIVVMLAVSTVVAWMGDGSIMTTTALVIALSSVPPVMQYRVLKRKVEWRKKTILLRLPVFLNKVMLLVNAGENVQKAVYRCAGKGDAQISGDPFARQLTIVRKQLDNMYPFAQALDEFSRRCGVHEATVFATAVMTNHKRGGEQFVSALRRLSGELWEKRKSTVRSLGEEASAKMIFPLVVIFMLVMVIVGAPAMMII